MRSRLAWMPGPPTCTISRMHARRSASVIWPCRMSSSNCSGHNSACCDPLEIWRNGLWARLNAEELSELAFQHLHNLPDRFFIPPVPPPLPLLGRINQPSLCQDGHVMGDRGLREMDALLN